MVRSWCRAAIICNWFYNILQQSYPFHYRDQIGHWICCSGVEMHVYYATRELFWTTQAGPDVSQMHHHKCEVVIVSFAPVGWLSGLTCYVEAVRGGCNQFQVFRMPQRDTPLKQLLQNVSLSDKFIRFHAILIAFLVMATNAPAIDCRSWWYWFISSSVLAFSLCFAYLWGRRCLC